jgi:hypothetical protein
MIFSLPIITTITPTKAQLEGSSATAPNAGLWFDPSADQWKYGTTGILIEGGISEEGEVGEMMGGTTAGIVGELAPAGRDDRLVVEGRAIAGVPSEGMGDVIPMTTDQGVGEIYVDRQIQPAAPQQRTPGIGEIYVDRQIKAEGYKGIGAMFVDKNQVYYEQGQRYPAIIGF